MLTEQDKAAIEHIASVSKHPHAAMIVEWLITDAKVEYFEDYGPWVLCDEYLIWHKEVKYRLVYPKIKPAYRVYRHKKTGCTYSRDSIDGTRDNRLTEYSEWISEWIEYDEPKQWPTPLVERIAAIDRDAAQWIVENWDDLVAGEYSTNNKDVNAHAGTLNMMFIWGLAPQGDKYWRRIYKKLS